MPVSSRRTLLMALRFALRGFRGAEPAPPAISNADPSQIRIAYHGHLVCRLPRFNEGRLIRGGVLFDFEDDPTDTIAFREDDPPRWSRVRRRWAAKLSRGG